mmetsp:Transcript_11439/g.27302  ORF Transcript_11439/g.27302 Transcript_11439/m.27302 type:complete len:496 (+) Transcript_11439:30-1517(+)
MASSSNKSKLDYLSKYLVGGSRGGTNDDYEDFGAGRNAKKSKKEKKRKKKKSERKNKIKKEDAVVAYDEDDIVDSVIRPRRGEHSNLNEIDDYDGINNEEDEEDRPVVVDSGLVEVAAAEDNIPRSSAASSGGTWTTVKKEEEEASDEGQSSRRRRRYDSDDDSDDDSNSGRAGGGGSSSGEPHHHRHKKRRHDSDSDDTSDDNGRRQQRRRYDSDESNSNNSSGSGRSNDRPRQQTNNKRTRHDSDGESDSHREGDRRTNQKNRRQRYDSDDSSASASKDKRERMSSGHKAGLQDYKDFNKSERKIQARKTEDAERMVDKYGMGETVYRDKHGRKQEGSHTNGSTANKEAIQLDAEAQRRLNEGAVQQQAQRATAEEMAILRESSFARYQDDDRLENIRRNEIREGDPMVQYSSKKKSKKGPSSSSPQDQLQDTIPSKPVYKGPPAKPNRYGIRPGYRWDGIDRGNGFEDKLLAQKYSSNLKKEEAYRYRSADM